MSEAQSERRPEPPRGAFKSVVREDCCLAADVIVNGSDAISEFPGGTPFILHCGACGQRVHAFRDSDCLPQDAGVLKELLCPSCLTPNFQHSLILTTAGSSGEWFKRDRHACRSYIRDRFDWRFWSGHIVSDSAVDDPEAFIHSSETPMLRSHQQREPGLNDIGWEPSCPVCGVADDGTTRFDFHHWDYEDDVGVQLCRDCHNHAHGGQRISDRPEQDGWREEAKERLISRMKSNVDVATASFQRLMYPDSLE